MSDEKFASKAMPVWSRAVLLGSFVAMVAGVVVITCGLIMNLSETVIIIGDAGVIGGIVAGAMTLMILTWWRE